MILLLLKVAEIIALPGLSLRGYNGLKDQIRCFRKKASMSMAKQKAPNARRAIVEQ
jgi:hypothetical protein